MLKQIKNITNKINGRLGLSGLALIAALAAPGCYGTCLPKQYSVLGGGCAPCECSSDYDCINNSSATKCGGCNCYDSNPSHEYKEGSLRQQGIDIPSFKEYTRPKK